MIEPLYQLVCFAHRKIGCRGTQHTAWLCRVLEREWWRRNDLEAS